jgi:4-hydroxy-2-oxoglutarate aldolase
VTAVLRGLFAPVTTPFSPQGAVDLDALAVNVRAHLDAGVDGIVVAGSTGEAPLLDDGERRRLLELVRTLVDGSRRLIAGTGAESTRQCVQRCREAAAVGAELALVVAPHYFTPAMTPAALLAHYRRVADESPIPVVLYNIPKYAHFVLPPAVVAELAVHGNVAGIKDSSGDLALLDEYLAAQHDGFSVLTGNATTTLAALRHGARGGVLAVALFAGPLVRRLVDAHAAGDAEADALQARLAPLATRIVGELGVAGVKAALDAVGLAGGAPRSPLLPLAGREEAQVRELLRAALDQDTPAAQTAR